MPDLREEYKTILGHSQVEFEIKKSRFIANIKRCNSEDESLQFIEEISKLHRDATHNCTAYINGPQKMVQRYNDNGEPQGTAGIPMLEVLKKEDLTDIAVVVTRYFGGKKLGASGLIRAYGGAVSEVLKSATIVTLKNYYIVELNFDYTHLGKIDNYIGEENFHIKSREFLEKVNNIMYISVNDYNTFKNSMNVFTSGAIDIKIKETILLEEKDGEIIEDGRT